MFRFKTLSLHIVYQLSIPWATTVEKPGEFPVACLGVTYLLRMRSPLWMSESDSLTLMSSGKKVGLRSLQTDPPDQRDLVRQLLRYRNY